MSVSSEAYEQLIEELTNAQEVIKSVMEQLKSTVDKMVRHNEYLTPSENDNTGQEYYTKQSVKEFMDCMVKEIMGE